MNTNGNVRTWANQGFVDGVCAPEYGQNGWATIFRIPSLNHAGPGLWVPSVQFNWCVDQPRATLEARIMYGHKQVGLVMTSDRPGVFADRMHQPIEIGEDVDKHRLHLEARVLRAAPPPRKIDAPIIVGDYRELTECDCNISGHQLWLEEAGDVIGHIVLEDEYKDALEEGHILGLVGWESRYREPEARISDLQLILERQVAKSDATGPRVPGGL